jgi:hypothetical protein
MTIFMLLEHLAFVEQYLERGDELIATQRNVIEELRHNGHDLDQAEGALEALVRSKMVLSDERDRLVVEYKARSTEPE